MVKNIVKGWADAKFVERETAQFANKFANCDATGSRVNSGRTYRLILTLPVCVGDKETDTDRPTSSEFLFEAPEPWRELN
jgi:hypothetical protein